MARLDFSGLTCVIPTHNRVAFLRRQLEYIAGAGDFPQVMVIDSSEPQQALLNRQMVSESGLRKVEYRHDASPFFEKLTRGLQRATTPFVVLCADDDTLSPHGLVVSTVTWESPPPRTLTTRSSTTSLFCSSSVFQSVCRS